MEFPAAIAPWSEELGLFRSEIALALGALVARVAHALGPRPSPTRDARDEPDGFGGLTRRGSYERLLLSEWLLANEAPDEFTRRAASGEHAFLAVEHSSPSTERETLAVFDAGPTQLGAPRLAHLAVLIALARRALDAGATLRWSVLQEGERDGRVVMRSGVTPQTIKALFETARTTEPTLERVSQIRATANPETGQRVDRDTWIVGGARAARIAAAGQASSVEVSDVIDDGPKRVRVVITSAASHPRALELELPPDPLVAKVFRDPFRPAEEKAPLPRSGGRVSLVFASSGTKLYGRLPRSFRVRDFAMTVPEGRNAGVRITGLRELAPWEGVAIGRLERNTYGLIVDPPSRALTLRIGKERLAAGHFTTEPGVHAPWRPDPDGALEPLHVRRAGNAWSAFFCDERRWLFAWSASGGRATLVERGVVALACDGARLVCVSSEPEPRLSVFPAQPTETFIVPHVVMIGEEPIREAVIHFRPDTSVLAAVRVASDRWRVVDAKDGFVSAEFEVADTLTIVGIAPSPFARGALVAVDRSTGRVLLTGPNWARDVVQLEAGKTAIAVDARGRTLAAMDDAGRLEIASLRTYGRLGVWDLAKEIV